MDEFLIYHGDAVKALDDSGRVGGYLVKFGSPAEKDIHNEYFAADGYYGPQNGDGAEAIFGHGYPIEVPGASPDVRQAMKALADHTFRPLETTRDAVGIWAETVLDLANDYEKMVHGLVKRGKLGWSSGAPVHRVKTEADGRIVRWPIAEGSLTPQPANPQSRAVALKSLLAPADIEDAFASADAATAIKSFFDRQLSERNLSTWDLWTTLNRAFGEIAKAASAQDVTGVPVSIKELTATALTSFGEKLIPAVTLQIETYLASEAEKPFTLKGAAESRLKEILTDSDVAFRDSLPDHSKAVASAAEELAALSGDCAQFVKDYAGRVARKSAFRGKEGRVLSRTTFDLITSARDSVEGSISNLTATRDSLSGLMEKARKVEVEESEAKSAAVKVSELRARFLRMEAGRVGAAA